MASKALVLIDLQNEWIDEDSDYYVGDIFALIEKTNELIEYCRREGYCIIFTRHIEPDMDEAFVEGSRNIEIIDGIVRRDSDVLTSKHKISPFYQTNLEEHLEGVEELVIHGLLTNLYVRSFAHDAYEPRFSDHDHHRLLPSVRYANARVHDQRPQSHTRRDRIRKTR